MASVDSAPFALRDWLNAIGVPAHFELQALNNDASFRSYFRVRGGNISHIAMVAPPNKENTAAFVAIAKNFFSQGIHVPEILACNLERGFLLLSDLGDELYLNLLCSDTAEDLYTKALAVLPRIQACRPQLENNQPLAFFGEDLIRGELNLFVDWFLARHLQYKLTSRWNSLLQNDFQRLAVAALEQPQVCVHRDYHSRNLLLVDKKEVGVLDFQDAVYGPITYDAVSLLRDAYIDWPEMRVTQWVLAFRDMLIPEQRTLQAEKFIRWFDFLGIQRHLKILGIFSRLCYRDRKPQYLTYTGRLLKYLQQICAKYAELNTLRQLLLSEVVAKLRETAGGSKEA